MCMNERLAVVIILNVAIAEYNTDTCMCDKTLSVKVIRLVKYLVEMHTTESSVYML